MCVCGTAALGRYWGFVNAFNSLLSNICDLPIYPVLYSNYVTRFLGLGDGAEWLVKVVSLVIIVLLNIRGMEAVTCSSLVMTIVLFAPFVVEAFLDLPHRPDWTGVAKEIDWATAVASLLWAYQVIATTEYSPRVKAEYSAFLWHWLCLLSTLSLCVSRSLETPFSLQRFFV